MYLEVVQNIRKNAKEIVDGVHTCFPAKIVEYDASKGLASVQPCMTFKKPNGELLDYPQINGVPVVYFQSMAQDATIAYPIKSGDGCLVVVAEQPLDKWMYDRDTDTDLKFDLTNSICIVGMFTDPNPNMQEACDDDAIIIDRSGTRIKITSDKVDIKCGSTRLEVDGSKVSVIGDLYVSGEVTAAGDVVGAGKSLSTHKHTDSQGGSTTAPI